MSTSARGEWRTDLGRSLLAVTKILKFGIFPFASYLPVASYRRLSFAVRFRRCFEEMGLTYLKLGQFLALRFDILPPEVCQELNRLFEKAEPMSSATALSIVEAELGGPIGHFFSDFTEEPIAAASVAQVHEARLVTGQRVAVKVQRAGIEPIFRADIRNLRRIAAMAQALGLFGQLSGEGMVKQFAKWTLREMDFRIEGHTAERVRRDAGPNVVIPIIHWSHTTARVLTMDFVEGVSAANLRTFVEEASTEALQERLPGFDLDTALHNLTVASLSQLFILGFYHGDPHPGNIRFLPGNRVAFLDFGIFGELTDDEREIVTGQIENLALGNLVRSFHYYARQVVATKDTEMDRFRADCLEVLGRWYRALSDPDSPMEERHLSRYTGEMIDASRRHALIYDLNYLLFWRTLNNLNATLWHVKPEFNLIHELRAFFEENRPDPLERILTAIRRPAWQQAVADIALRFPQSASENLETLVRGEARLSVTVSRSDRMQRDAAKDSRWGAALLLALPAAVIVTAAPLPWALRLAAAGLIASVAFVAAVRRS